MADRNVTIELDRPRALRVNLGSLARAEELTGRHLLTEAGWKGLSARDILALLFAFLSADDPELTQEQLGELVDVSDMDLIVEAIEEVMGFGDDDEAAAA